MPCNWHWVQGLFREEIVPSDKLAWLFSNLPRPHESTDLHQSTREKMAVPVEMKEFMDLAEKFFISYLLPFQNRLNDFAYSTVQLVTLVRLRLSGGMNLLVERS